MSTDELFALAERTACYTAEDVLALRLAGFTAREVALLILRRELYRQEGAK